MPFEVDPLWSFLVTDLDGVGITLLDHLASGRTVTQMLNAPSQITGDVPSDNPEVNLLHTDGFPFVAEGVRQLYCFRRESDVDPNWIIRSSGLILQVDDAAASDNSRSRLTAFDPFQYLYYLPCCINGGEGAAGVVGPEGLKYAPGVTPTDIIEDLIDSWQDYWDNNYPTAPTATRSFFSSFGTFEATHPLASGYKIECGASMGQVFADLCASSFIDIVFQPVYDTLQPGIMAEMQIYDQFAPANGAGQWRYDAIFAWDRPGRSAVGMDDMFDGTMRANNILYFNGQGGKSVPIQISTDLVMDFPYPAKTSIEAYGPYWSQQMFPAQTQVEAVVGIAQLQLALRNQYKQTLTVNPATLRAPSPFVDYQLGDRVPVYASTRLRQELVGYQRIFGIPIEINDNSTEMVRELIVGPAGPPPPPAAPFAELGTGQSSQAAIGAGLRGVRGGTQAVLGRPVL